MPSCFETGSNISVYVSVKLHIEWNRTPVTENPTWGWSCLENRMRSQRARKYPSRNNKRVLLNCLAYRVKI